MSFESIYCSLVTNVLNNGVRETGRNGDTLSVFGRTLVITDLLHGKFPILQGRKSFYKGVFGELAALFRQPKHISDFEAWGCNYWKQWANEDGSINVDYGNAWFDFNGFDQIADLKDKLKNNPKDRRMIVTGWRPDNLANLNLPCCHCLYQFHVQNGRINMLWYQRSVDVMIGLPADAILAAAWLIMIANEFGLEPGTITMNFGDTHIYAEHEDKAHTYLRQVNDVVNKGVHYSLSAEPGKDFTQFEPSDITLEAHEHGPRIDFELKE